MSSVLARLALDPSEPVAVDTEATGTRLYQGDLLRGVSVAVGSDSWYLPVSHPDSDNLPRQDVARVLRAVREHDTVVMHSGAFDRASLALGLGIEFEDDQVWDTLTVHWLTGEDRNHGLKGIAADLFGVDAKAEALALKALFRGRSVEDAYCELREVEKQKERAQREPAPVTRERARKLSAGTRRDWATVTADDIRAYARRDAELTLALYLWQQDYLNQHPEYRPALARERRVAGLAYRMTRTGVRVDLGRAEQALAAARKRLADLAGKWPHVNLNAPSQVADLMYGEWSLPVPRRTATGAPSTDKLALQALVSDPRVQDLLEHRRLAKEVDAFFIPLTDRTGNDGRVHPSWNAHRVKTGRWSCSEPGLQQVPREGPVRDVFVPEPGFVFVHADLPNAELRVAAILASEPLWLAAFRDGEDLHQAMASAAGVPRQVAKAINFSALYGVGPRKLAQTLAQGTGQPPDVTAASRMLDAYWAAVPRVKQLFDGLAESWVRRGRLPIRPWPGRFRHIEGRFGPELSYRALNSVIQGSVAEATKDWLLDLEPLCAAEGWILVAQIHDAVVLETPEGREDDARRRLQESWDRVNPFGELPWPLDITVGGL